MNIALLSPSQNAYSETFIQAHKKSLDGTIFHYFSGELPTELEGGLIINSRKKRIVDILKGHYRLNKFSLEEQALITSFKNNNIDIVFAEYGGTGERIVPVCKALGLPLIVHFHGFDASRKDQLETHENYKGIFAYANYIVVVSRKMEQDLLNLGCPKNKIVYNVYGPREEFAELKPVFLKEQFIAVGRFVDKKAPYYLIYAFVKILDKFPRAKLIMGGDGELLNTCKNMVSYLNLEASILFPGVISAQQFKDYLQESLAFVQHSITAENGDSEGTPLVVLEAGAAGLPVIATKHAGIPDVVSHGETGYLIEEHDVDGMANFMLDLLIDPSIAKKLGDNAKVNISKHFTMERHIVVLNKLIEKAVNCK
jgi:glycosyltransferase involved in cell wall biosynthesis